MNTTMKESAHQLAVRFSSMCNIGDVEYRLERRGEETFLALRVGAENSIYDRNIAEILDSLPDDHPFASRIYLAVRRPSNWLRSNESILLKTILSESLVVGETTLDEDVSRNFVPFSRQEQIAVMARTNSLIFGRRGAGKSSLLLYCKAQCDSIGKPWVWLSLQPYHNRSDAHAVAEVLQELVGFIRSADTKHRGSWDKLFKGFDIARMSESATKESIRKLLPAFDRQLKAFVEDSGRLYILVDDLYLLSPKIQPFLLYSLLSLSRGKRIHVKITSVQHLTHLYDDEHREGWKIAHDGDLIPLDRNLTDPYLARQHIEKIIENYVKFVGIPGIASICPEKALDRLTWASAGVPRDALYIFGRALVRATTEPKRSKIAVEDINLSAGESLADKNSSAWSEVSTDKSALVWIVEDIRRFCVEEKRKNAFLVRNDPANTIYDSIRRVSDLRFIHMVHAGLTPHEVGKVYEAYMLDFSFYTGFRRARSVSEFIHELRKPRSKEVRNLPIYDYERRQRNAA